MSTQEIGPALGFKYSSLIENAGSKRGGDHHAFAQNILLVSDFCLVCVSALVAWYLRFVVLIPKSSIPTHISRERFIGDMAFLLLYAALFVLFAYAHKLYIDPLTKPLHRELSNVLKSSGFATLMVTSVIYLSGEKMVARPVVVATAILSTGLLVIRRFVFRGRGLMSSRNVVIVGAGRVGLALSQYLTDNPRLGYVVVGFIDRRMAGRYSIPADANETVPMLGKIADIKVIVKRLFIDEILVTLPGDRNLVRDVAVHAKSAGIDLRVVPDLYDGLAYGAPVQFIGHFPMLAVYQQPIPTVQLFLKRMFDIVGSIVVLTVSAPVLAGSALAIKLNSRGPVFHRSTRVGKKGSTFTLYKLRTMVADAELRRKELDHLNERDGVLFKISNDPRVTPVGRMLRKYSIDELPQLWNVLKGNMSLVGPRPALPGEYKQYEICHLRRLEVVPGITGLWQVEARQSPSFYDYIKRDLEYVENWSIWLDVKLLFRTACVVLAGTGS